jgi:hypothetical protein
MYFGLYGFTVDAVLVNRLLPDDVSDPFFRKWRKTQEQFLDEARATSTRCRSDAALRDDQVAGAALAALAKDPTATATRRRTADRPANAKRGATSASALRREGRRRAGCARATYLGSATAAPSHSANARGLAVRGERTKAERPVREGTTGDGRAQRKNSASDSARRPRSHADAPAPKSRRLVSATSAPARRAAPIRPASAPGLFRPRLWRRTASSAPSPAWPGASASLRWAPRPAARPSGVELIRRPGDFLDRNRDGRAGRRKSDGAPGTRRSRWSNAPDSDGTWHGR